MSPRRNWDPLTPFPASEWNVPPPGTKRGAHSPAGEGVGESQFRRLEKKLSTLSITLWKMLMLFHRPKKYFLLRVPLK